VLILAKIDNAAEQSTSCRVNSWGSQMRKMKLTDSRQQAILALHWNLYTTPSAGDSVARIQGHRSSSCHRAIDYILAWNNQWHNSDKVETGRRKIVIAILLSLDHGCNFWIRDVTLQYMALKLNDPEFLTAWMCQGNTFKTITLPCFSIGLHAVI